MWAKHLFSQLFGEPDADNDVSPETEEGEGGEGEEGEKMEGKSSGETLVTIDLYVSFV